MSGVFNPGARLLEFTKIEGVLYIMVDGGKFIEVNTKSLAPGLNTPDI